MSLIPSRFLPARVSDASEHELAQALARLRAVYAIGVPREMWVWEGECAGEDEETDDAFEAQYVRTWLHRLVQYGCTHAKAADLVDEAASVLVHLAGQAACGERWCTYYFFLTPHAPRHSDEAVASVSICDGALVGDALGIRTWGAAPYLTRRLIQQYASADQHVLPRRVLELGAGTGLVGLGLAQWLGAQRADARVTLTDYDATVLANLRRNAEASHSLADVRHLDWETVYRDMQTTTRCYDTWAQKTLPHESDTWSAQYGGVDRHDQFDVLVAADCIYDPQHALWIHAVAERHLLRPTTAYPSPQLHMLVPVRRTHLAELASVHAVFSESSSFCIAQTHVIQGHDDFGPPSMSSQSPRTRKGNPITCQHFVIEWRHDSPFHA